METKPPGAGGQPRRGSAQGRDASGGPRATTAPSGAATTTRAAKSLKGAAPGRLALTAETFPSQHVPSRRNVAQVEEGTQTTPSLEMLLKQQWSLGKKRRKNRNGTHRVGSSKEGTHRDWNHRDGTHRDGSSKEGTHRDWNYQDGIHRNGSSKEGTHRDWNYQDGIHRNGSSKEGTHQDWNHRDGSHHDRSSKEGTDRDWTHWDRNHRDGSSKEGIHQEWTHSQAREQHRASRASCDRDVFSWVPSSSGLMPTEDDDNGTLRMRVTDEPQGRKSKVSWDLYPDKEGEEDDQDVLEKEGPLPAGLLSGMGRLCAQDVLRALRVLGLPAGGAELRRALQLVPEDEHGTLNLHDVLGALRCTGAAAAASEAFQPIYETFGRLKRGSIAAADLQPALLSLGVRVPPTALPGARSAHNGPERAAVPGRAPAQQAMQAALEPFDRIKADSIEVSKLRYILQAMDIHPTEQEFEEALQMVALEKDRTVNLAAFMTALSSTQHSSDLLDGSFSTLAAPEDTVGDTSGFEDDQMAMRDLLACASHLGIQEGLEKASVEAMQEVLEVIRKVKNNQMEVSQLGEVLANMGIVLPEEELREALSKVPFTGDEKLNFKEFMKSLTSIGRLSETTRKEVDVRELKTGAQMGTRAADQKLQEALEAADGDKVALQDLDSIVGSGGGPLTSEDLQEALGHTEEDGVAVDDVGSVLATMGIHLNPEELQEVLSCVSVEGDKISIQDLNSILSTKGLHLTSEELQEALGHVASIAHKKVNSSEFMKAGRAGQEPPLGEEDKVDVNNVGSILASMGIHLTPEELQEAQKHVPVDEGGNVSLSTYMRSVMSMRRPSQAEKNRVDIQSLDNILRSAGIHLGSEEMQEALRQVSPDADGRVNLSEFMQRVKTVQGTDQGAAGHGSSEDAQENLLRRNCLGREPEKAPPALGHVSKASISKASISKVRVLHPLPRKKVLKSILKKATREHSCIAQRRSKSKTAKNLTKKQLEAFYDAFSFFPKDPGGNIDHESLQEMAAELGISLTTQEANRELVFADADGDGKVNFFDFLSIVTDKKRFMQAIVPEKKYRGKGDSASATGILLFEVLSKLVELAALPQKTLLEIVRYYRQKFLRCMGQKAWKESNSLMYCRKKHRRIRKDQACVSSFVNAARISFMNNKDLLAYVESLKACVPLSDSPYAQVPIFPLIPKQEVMIVGRPKKDLQKLERQRRSEPIASFQNHFFRKRNWVQEAMAPKVPAGWRRQQSSAPPLSKPCRPTRDTLGRIQAESKWLSQQYRQGLALHERARLLRLWRRLRGGRIGLETGNESFHRIFSIYSWSWNVCQELLTPDELRRADNELFRRAWLRAPQ